VTAEDDRLEAILPLVARPRPAAVDRAAERRGGDPRGRPERRLELATKIIETATGRYGISDRGRG